MILANISKITSINNGKGDKFPDADKITVFLENPKDSHEKASYKRIWCVEYKINYRSNQSSSVQAKVPKKGNGKNI